MTYNAIVKIINAVVHAHAYYISRIDAYFTHCTEQGLIGGGAFQPAISILLLLGIKGHPFSYP